MAFASSEAAEQKYDQGSWRERLQRKIFYACIRYGNSIECMRSRPKVSFTDHSYSGLPPGFMSRIGGGALQC